MAFSVNMDGPNVGASRNFRSSGRGRASAIALACVFAAFCVYDYSPYGYGVVAQSLGNSQHWFQGFVGTFRLRM